MLEAEGEPTPVRLRWARTFVSYRSLGVLEPLFAPHGFLRIHRNHMVNLRRVHRIRRRQKGADPERRARFEREAQAVAALNHPTV